MSFPQIQALANGMAIPTIDSYDVPAISFAAPGIFKEWHLTPAALGTALSMELIGMAAGSMLLGSLRTVSAAAGPSSVAWR